MNEEFIARLRITFDNESMADVARRLKIPHATVRNYYQGRLPAPEVLIKIANETGVSLNWLLTGAGDRYGAQSPPISIGKFLDERIQEMIDEKFEQAVRSSRSAEPIGDYDVESAVLRLDNPEQIMGEWFRQEGREYPYGHSDLFFGGWDTYSPSEKTDALRDAKRVLDRSLK
jgi:transcriptional regulator with XRE-family HTH domain